MEVPVDETDTGIQHKYPQVVIADEYPVEAFDFLRGVAIMPHLSAAQNKQCRSRFAKPSLAYLRRGEMAEWSKALPC